MYTPRRRNQLTRPSLPHTNNSVTLADVVQAESRMGWTDQRLADLVADYAEEHMDSFDAAHLGELMSGLASVG